MTYSLPPSTRSRTKRPSRRKTPGCGTRTAAGFLKAIFESSDVERFAWVFNKPPRRTAVPAPCVAAITRLETRIAAGRSIARGRWARAMPLNTKHNFPEARLPSNSNRPRAHRSERSSRPASAARRTDSGSV